MPKKPLNFEKFIDFEPDWDAWTELQMDGDNNTGTKAELVQFFLQNWLIPFKIHPFQNVFQFRGLN